MSSMKTQSRPVFISLIAGSDLSTKQSYFMTLSSGKLAVAGAGDPIVGVLDDKPDADGEIGRVQIGGIAVVLAGNTCTRDTGAASDASGKAVNASGSARVIGVFLESGSAGDYVRVLLQPTAFAQAADQETKTSGALTPAVPTSFLSITGSQAFTLADGTVVGQRKYIEVTVAASTPLGTLTINDAHTSEPTTHVFTAVGQRLELEWWSTGWKIIGKRRAGSLTVVVGTDVLTGYDMVGTYNLSVTGTVSSTTTKAIPDGTLEGEVIWIRCTTAASTPNGSIGITAKTLAGAAATAAAVNATTDYEYLRWDGAAWQELITNSVTLS